MRFPILKYVKIKGKWRYKIAVLDRGVPEDGWLEGCRVRPEVSRAAGRSGAV
jgi:hypothetical protein